MKIKGWKIIVTTHRIDDTFNNEFQFSKTQHTQHIATKIHKKNDSGWVPKVRSYPNTPRQSRAKASDKKFFKKKHLKSLNLNEPLVTKFSQIIPKKFETDRDIWSK